VNSLPILENRLFFVGSSKREFSSTEYDSSLFKELTLIYREKGSATRMVMEQFIEKKKITVSKQIELTSNEAVKQALIAGLGYSIMPLIGIRNELRNKELQIIPVKGLPVKSEWRLIWLKQKKLSPVAEAFVEFTKKNKHQAVANHFGWISHKNFKP
jgi:DNA-binding transcriptional LysR family regulator